MDYFNHLTKKGYLQQDQNTKFLTILEGKKIVPIGKHFSHLKLLTWKSLFKKLQLNMDAVLEDLYLKIHSSYESCKILLVCFNRTFTLK